MRGFPVTLVEVAQQIVERDDIAARRRELLHQGGPWDLGAAEQVTLDVTRCRARTFGELPAFRGCETIEIGLEVHLAVCIPNGCASRQLIFTSQGLYL